MNTIEKYLGIFMLLFAIGFNLWIYRMEPTALMDPNDNNFQYALVDRTNRTWDFAQKECSAKKTIPRIKVPQFREWFLDNSVYLPALSSFSLFACRLPLLIDHWVPNWNEGYNLPYYYSHLPQIAIVGSYRLLHWFSKFSIFNFQFLINFSNFKFQISNLSLFQYYHFIIYLLLCFFPLSVFLSLRLIRLPWLSAGIGALIASQISTDGLYGLDPPSFLWRGYGLSSQLFAMIFLPLAIAYSFKLLNGNNKEGNGKQFLEQLKKSFSQIARGSMPGRQQTFGGERARRGEFFRAPSRPFWQRSIDSLRLGLTDAQQKASRDKRPNCGQPQRDLLFAVFFLAATAAGHLGIGMITFISVGVIAISPIIYSMLSCQRVTTLIRDLGRQISKLFVLTGSAILLLSYWIVPAFLADKFHNFSFWDPVWKFNSYGAFEILKNLLNGDLFDYGRFPILTILVFIGLFAALWPKSIADELNTGLTRLFPQSKQIRIPGIVSRGRERVSPVFPSASLRAGPIPNSYSPFSLLFIFWLLMYFGRSTWGGLLDIIPGIKEFHQSRFIIGVHLAGLFLIPIGVENAVSSIRHLVLRSSNSLIHNTNHIIPLTVTVILLSVSMPHIYRQTIAYSTHNDTLIRQANANYQKIADDVQSLFTQLLSFQASNSGRVYFGRGGNWGKDFKVAETPWFIYGSTFGVPAILWMPQTWSPNADTEQYFNDARIEDYELYNIRYVVTPPIIPASDIRPFWKLIKQTASWRLYEVYPEQSRGVDVSSLSHLSNVSSGYFATGVRPTVVASSKNNYKNIVRFWIQSDYPKQGLYPQLVLSDSSDVSALSSFILPHFLMTDESTYQIPDGTTISLFAEHPIYLPPGVQTAEQFKQTTMQQYNNTTILSQEQTSDMVFKAKIEVKGDCRECLVVLKQTYHPSWRATIDGKKTEVINVFPFYNAVLLDKPGTHEIIFSYQPSLLKMILLFVSITTTIALIFLSFA